MPVTKILSSTRLRTFVLVLLAGIALAGMSGCRATDVLKLIVYDQSSEQVDYERDQKVYISDETSETLSDKVSADEISEDVPATNEVQNLVSYASDPNMMSFPTKDSIFSLTPSFAGFEASRGVQYYLSDSEDSLYYELPEEELED